MSITPAPNIFEVELAPVNLPRFAPLVFALPNAEPEPEPTPEPEPEPAPRPIELDLLSIPQGCKLPFNTIYEDYNQYFRTLTNYVNQNKRKIIPDKNVILILSGDIGNPYSNNYKKFIILFSII